MVQPRPAVAADGAAVLISRWRGRKGEGDMNFKRTLVGLLIVIVAGLAGAFFVEGKIWVQVRTVKAFVEGAVFADAVAACEKAPSSTPFKWNDGSKTSVVGLNSVQLDKDTAIASYTLVADGVYCD